jgi:hypothetical protein
MENGKLRFDGQIMWRKGKNTLQWSVIQADAATGRLTESIEKAVFKSGDLTTNIECQREAEAYSVLHLSCLTFCSLPMSRFSETPVTLHTLLVCHPSRVFQMHVLPISVPCLLPY